MHQAYCNCLASDVMADTCARSIRGEWAGIVGIVRLKKIEQGRGPAPKTRMDISEIFVFSSETAAALRRLILPRLGPRGRRRRRLLSASTSRISTISDPV